jgi:hypothetical protein
MIELKKASTMLMSTASLIAVGNLLVQQAAAIGNKVAATQTKSDALTGQSTVQTGANGQAVINADSGNTGDPGTVQADANAVKAVADAGYQPFVPGTVPNPPEEGTLEGLYNDASDLAGDAVGFINRWSGNVMGLLHAYRGTIAALNILLALIEKNQAVVNERLTNRAAGIEPEPEVNLAALDLPDLPIELRGDIDKAIKDYEDLVVSQVIVPLTELEARKEAVKLQLSGIGEQEPVFDLEFGPPISAANKFILSKDGLYYNSRTQDVPVIEPKEGSETTWDLDYASNVGGRGLTFSEDDTYGNFGTVFHIDTNIGKGNPVAESYHKYDDVLQQFNDDKVSQITEVSGYVTELIANDYSDSDALVQSYTAQLAGVASTYDYKIKKRKKQLDLAAVYGRDTFFLTTRDHPLGEGLFFQYHTPVGKAFEYNLRYKDLNNKLKNITFLSIQTDDGPTTVAWNKKTNKITDVADKDTVMAAVGEWVQIPRIPINDFSYLRESDISLDTQTKLTLFSEDLDTVVAPHQARYVVAPNTPETYSENLSVDPIGLGDWVKRKGSRSLSSSEPLYKSLTDDIVEDELVACYNFLDPEAITEPSGSLYALNNAAEGSTRLDAKLVGTNANRLFPSGVGTAYFGGTIYDMHLSESAVWADIKGSYARLPNITKDYQIYNQPNKGTRVLDNLFYSMEGVTLDFWAYVPRVHQDMTDEHRYRLVFANENSGPTPSQFVLANPNDPQGKGTDGSKTVGMMMGWRDKGSPQHENSYVTSGLEFFIAPTVGQNQKYTRNPNTSWGHSVCLAEKWGDTNAPTPSQVSAIGMFIPSATLNANGSGIADVSSSYLHFNVAFDYGLNEVRVCLDGVPLSTSSLEDVLGVDPRTCVMPTAAQIGKHPPLPSDPTRGTAPSKESFLGVNIYDEPLTPERVSFPVFTPWIIGGGYTDNIPSIEGTDYRPMGFLGSNTNNTYQLTQPGADVVTTTIGSVTYIKGQHNPPLSNSKGFSGPTTRVIPRSGLDGYVGSFKIYGKPLTTTEAKINFDAQEGFFKNILTP